MHTTRCNGVSVDCPSICGHCNPDTYGTLGIIWEKSCFFVANKLTWLTVLQMMSRAMSGSSYRPLVQWFFHVSKAPVVLRSRHPSFTPDVLPYVALFTHHIYIAFMSYLTAAAYRWKGSAYFAHWFGQSHALYTTALEARSGLMWSDGITLVHSIDSVDLSIDSGRRLRRSREVFYGHFWGQMRLNVYVHT